MSTPYWRCFHCNECFTDTAKAQEHFGHGEHHEPACQIDIAKYREMESYVQRAVDEDTDALRQVGRIQSDHVMALLREEEKGYARGMRDLQKESTAVIESLLVLTAATFHALDDSEERSVVGVAEDVSEYVIDSAGYDAMSAALDTLEALPDDRPGYVMGPAAKARWALRNLLGDPENSSSSPTKEGE